MIETLLITWRESLEAALIVGILLTYLGRSGQRRGIRYVWAGSAAAALAAIACAAASDGLLAGLGPDAQEVAQAGILFLAVGVLTWMVLWMHRNARNLRGELHERADRALATGRLLGLATIAFAAVFREGLETVLFLWGVVVHRADASALSLMGAGLAGAALAVATAWIFFSGFRFLSLRTFFQVTGVLLLLVAGGLLTSAVNKLIGLGYLPPLVPQVWNTSWLLRDSSPLGAVLSALVGYRSRPSLLEVLAFTSYLPSMLWLLHRADRAATPAANGGTPARSAA
jgi:high-affinity iron transporter